MSRRIRKKKVTLERASPLVGGSLMYVPAQQQQSTYGQTFYGTKAGIPVGQQSIFSPGEPLPAQQNLNPLGQPIQR